MESGARPIVLRRAFRLFEEGRAIFLDARPAGAFALGQIQGSLCVPSGRTEELYPEILPWIEGQKTVVYSGTGELDAADDLAGFLLSRGQPRDSVFVFLDGFEAWRGAGYPVRQDPAQPAPDGAEPPPSEERQTEPAP